VVVVGGQGKDDATCGSHCGDAESVGSSRKRVES